MPINENDTVRVTVGHVMLVGALAYHLMPEHDREDG